MMVEFPVDRDYASMVDAVLSRCAEEPESPAAFGDMWARLSELGLTRLTGTEERGGSGAGWAEAATLHRLTGYHGLSLPLVEHDLLTGWLAEQLGLPLDERITSLTIRHGSGPVVPFGRHAERVLVVAQNDGWTVTDLGAATMTWRHHANIAGEPRDVLVADMASEVRVAIDDNLVEQLRVRGALARATQLCGALDRCVELATAHAAVREQFGRPLLKFQAVQALLADAAAEAALAQAATLGAITAMEECAEGSEDQRRAVAVAKSCASHAAGVVSRNTHQVMGAIGVTTEHALPRFSARLLAWRDEFGTRDDWDRRLLSSVLTDPVGGVWAAVVGA